MEDKMNGNNPNEDVYIEQQPNYYQQQSMPMYGRSEQDITNIVAQIDPKTIIDNLDHAFKGEHFNKENGEWIMNVSGKPMINDVCRSAIISYLDGILTNNTTMGNLDEKRLSLLMESIIASVKRMFISNIEEFGFVKTATKKKIIMLNGIYFLKSDNELEEYDNQEIDYELTKYTYDQYENKGTPDSSRMTMVSYMVYKVCFLVFTRALKGQESIRIFKSLSMSDPMIFGGMQQQGQQKGWMRKLFGL
jgi:hypothetical protein